MAEKHKTQVSEEKKKLVDEISKKILASKTVLFASTRGLPTSQFQKIKKALRGTADVIVAKKSTIERAIAKTEKGALQNMKSHFGADMVVMLSQLDSFELAAMLIDKQSPTKARAGDIVPEDIVIEPGPTDLVPGPAISELGSVGLKVSVEAGKLAIKSQTTIVKKGDIISDKVAGVLGKLKIEPMKVGFIPLVAYDAKEDKIYTEIKIDKKGTLESLRQNIAKAIGFARNINFVTKETISYFIAKAGREEKALANKLQGGKNE